MRKYIFAILILASTLCACSKDMAAPDDGIKFEERHDIALTKTQQEIVKKGNAFAFNFFAEICKADTDKEIFISPFSLEAALSMLCNGASGNTFTEIENALGYKGFTKSEINGTYRKLTEALLSADSSTKFSIANAMWLNKQFPVLPAFATTLTDNYGAKVENLDFNSQKALDAINSWTKENTGGMIPTLFEELDPDWVYILANALYFKGIWSEKFKTDQTKKEEFHCLSGKVLSTDFMHGEIPCRYAYSEELGAALCELPFGNKSFSLDILLPDDGIDFYAFVSGLSSEKWDAITGDLFSSEQYVIIPKMDVSYTGTDSFKNSLMALGIESAFGAGADFSALSDVPTCVSDVIQKARFKMDEDGAEAAAVTAIGAKMTSIGPSREFFADHPFIYAIREFSTGAILFMGACKNLQ